MFRFAVIVATAPARAALTAAPALLFPVLPSSAALSSAALSSAALLAGTRT